MFFIELNAMAFSPSGDHVLIGGDDSFSGRKIKYLYKNELVATYKSSSGLPESGEVVSLAMDSEAMTYVFFENEIYRGFLSSSTNEIAGEDVRLFSNLVDDYLAIENIDVKEGMIFSITGVYLGVFEVNQDKVDVSHLTS
jgi:hypothetical protein